MYDKLNRLAKKTNPLGATLYTYNKDSSLTGKTDGNGVQTGYVYDALQRPVAYIDGNGGKTAYLYDAMDRILSITTPEGNKESYSYDKAGRMRSVTDPNGLTTSYSYDLMDNLVKEVAESRGLQVGTPEYYQFCQKYVDPRNIPSSVIEDAIRNTTAVPGHTAGTFVHQTADVTVIVNDTGKVITVIPK